MAKQLNVAKKVKDFDAGTCTFKFTNGKVLIVDTTKMDRDMLVKLAVHGVAQKVGDGYASANDKGWTIDDCYDEASRIAQNLYDGIWNATGGSGVTILAEALARVTGESVEEAVDVIAKMSDEARKQLDKNADIKAAVLKIKAERAEAKAATAAGGSTDDLTALFNK